MDSDARKGVDSIQIEQNYNVYWTKSFICYNTIFFDQ